MPLPRARLLTGAATALVAAALATGCGDLSRGELQRGVQSLSALAAQGRLLADGVARDRTKKTYARVMSRTLGAAAQHEAEKLADATPASDAQRERDRAVDLAGELSELYGRLQTFAGDEHVGREVGAGMRRVQAKADALDESLGARP